jgi:cation transport regulator ChaC
VWIVPLLGATEIVLLVAVVYLTIVQFTRTRASSYIERFNSIDAFESRVAVDRWLQEHLTTRARLEALEADPSLRTHVRRFANLFQELGAAYQFGVADRRTVRVLFDALVIAYWERLSFWIYDYRAQTDPSLYARFEYLYRDLKSRRRGTGERPEYVLAYGSLMDPASLGAALGRPVSEQELIPVGVEGWTRRWSATESVRIDGHPGPTTAVFLDLAPAEGTRTSGAIVKVTTNELRRITVRERNYAPRDLRPDVRLIGDRHVAPEAAVWCFVGEEQHRVGPHAVLLESYVELVANAARRIDPALEGDIRRSAIATGHQVESGNYTFVDLAQAALV